MKILVIDNNPEEQANAISAIEDAGHEVVVTDDPLVAIDCVGSADAVITDMFFNPFIRYDHSESEHYKQNEPPMGLTMVILAMSLGKPVAVCTDGNHHGQELAFVYDGFIHPLVEAAQAEAKKESRPFGTSEIFRFFMTDAPFGWIEGKDWDLAVRAVVSRLPEQP